MTRIYFDTKLNRAFRAGHWALSGSVIGLILTGWDIYGAAPFLGFEFPAELTLDLGLSQALRWHFFLAWVFVLSCTVFVFGKWIKPNGGRIWPIRAAEILKEVRQLFHLSLAHSAGRYLHIQRLAYVVVYATLGLSIFSGLILWKPVQFQSLSFVFGDYEVARRVHFAAMAVLCAFFVVHVSMALLVPRTFLSMAFGIGTNRMAERP